ncbi:MAG: TPM domain-containing protein [Polyangiaceae bacterium]|nr:TPM domain-containing protein [Polyangiaceae bacterium]MCL4755191.1 TPM domain-containing protein [Myxococcales bacterium]
MFDQVARQELNDAIAAAEKGHRGEVRVHVERTSPQGTTASDRADQLFESFGMHRTREDTAVLLYVSFDEGRSAVHAGSGIGGATTPEFWKSVTAEIDRGFSIGEPLAGLCAALEQIGDVLRKHAAGEDIAGNELPDLVTSS